MSISLNIWLVWIQWVSCCIKFESMRLANALISPTISLTNDRYARFRSNQQRHLRAAWVLHHEESRRTSFAISLNAKTNLNAQNDAYADSDDDFETNDALLLKTVKKTQLADLCQQLNVPVSKRDTKAQLLIKLRQHAQTQIQQEKERQESYAQRVEDGFGDNPKERYEVLPGQAVEDDDDDDDFFVFYADTSVRGEATDKNQKDAEGEETTDNSPTPEDADNDTQRKASKPAYLTQSAVTAPPIPPDLKPNKDGERVVTVYSTKEQNDLTGVAAAQPGQTAISQDYLQASPSSSLSNAAASGGLSQSQPWDAQAANQKSKTTTQEVEKATETVTELVQLLLAMSGAPAFVQWAEDLDQMALYDNTHVPREFVGFDPAAVPMNVLASASKALRTGRGQVLEEVLRQFEVQAIGQDGMAGDTRDKGGGHYREVSKVRAFLEGFRRAEVRKLARETTTMLLDKLVQEGVDGLDMTLASMTRSSDDTTDYAGELNDSLLDYLNDAIRQQEKKVDQLVASRFEDSLDAESGEEVDDRIVREFEKGPEHHLGDAATTDAVDQLWNVTTEEGERVESIDPNDPQVKKVLDQELEKEQGAISSPPIPDSAPEKLLLLLSLLRERIKAEAAFAPDEKGRNLRLLAYCMRLATPMEREQLISRDLGRSLDRLDSFIELVQSSVEYGESTSYQLQPARTAQPLDMQLLKSILATAKSLRDKQAWKASAAMR